MRPGYGTRCRNMLQNNNLNSLKQSFQKAIQTIKTTQGFSTDKLNSNFLGPKKGLYLSSITLNIACLAIVSFAAVKPTQFLLSPMSTLIPVVEQKSEYEVFGFAPHWTFDRLDNVNFDVLTTMAYFGVPVQGNGNLDKSDIGYKVFKSDKATEIFQKAHSKKTRIVLTLTQMDNDSIRSLMDSEEAQERAIEQAVSEVKERGIDGINVDFEYVGDPGDAYRQKFTKFVDRLTIKMHNEIPSSRVTVSVYASAVRYPKIYDINALGKVSDGIFMMAYDFAVGGSETAMPTAPLYGHSTGDYWYDISTAVDDFLSQMPSEKLILGVPWYGYNYAVYEPGFKSETHKGYYVSSYKKTKKGKKLVKTFVKPKSATQTYTLATENIRPDNPEISNYKDGWDDKGQVGWKAYYSASDGAWRQIFIEDTRSLSIKYDFAKDKNLGGVGMWALGFDNGKQEMWDLLKDKFGKNLDKKMAYKNNE